MNDENLKKNFNVSFEFEAQVLSSRDAQLAYLNIELRRFLYLRNR